jgi:nicotinamide mononucleotide transporter
VHATTSFNTALNQVIDKILQEIMHYVLRSPIEVIGSITGIVSVWLTVRTVIWCWLWGIVSVLAYVTVFWQERLYADMALQLVFCGMNVYGWIVWRNGTVLFDNKRTPFQSTVQSSIPSTIADSVTANHEITNANRTTLLWSSCAIAVSTALWSAGLQRYTNASLPFADAFLTSVSLVAVWMQARKYLENWLLWLFADVLYVGLFAYKSLWLTSSLYAVFCIMAVAGFVQWRNLMRLQHPVNHTPFAAKP